MLRCKDSQQENLAVGTYWPKLKALRYTRRTRL